MLQEEKLEQDDAKAWRGDAMRQPRSSSRSARHDLCRVTTVTAGNRENLATEKERAVLAAWQKNELPPSGLRPEVPHATAPKRKPLCRWHEVWPPSVGHRTMSAARQQNDLVPPPGVSLVCKIIHRYVILDMTEVCRRVRDWPGGRGAVIDRTY